MFNEDVTKKTLEVQMSYEYDKREAILKGEQEKEQAISAEKAERQKLIIWCVILGLLIVVVFSISLLNRFRLTQKQKAIIEQQKLIVEEKQKNVLDSIYYAKRIQTSLLPTERYIKRQLERLKKK